jgi:hypothetical protein
LFTIKKIISQDQDGTYLLVEFEEQPGTQFISKDTDEIIKPGDKLQGFY